LDATRDRPDGPWKLARGELRRFDAEREKPSVVVGYDLTFSVAKSVSILWATATPSQQVAIEAAFTDAVRSGVRYLEEQAAHVRVSVGNDSGKGTHLERQAATGLVAAAYLHDTSRALDPQLHFHVVVANMAEGPDGKIRALDGRSLYLHAKTASHLAAAELRHRLSTDLGLTWQPVHRGLADVDGVSRDAIVEMSQRARQMRNHIDAMADHQPTTARGRQIAAYDTRAPKDTAVDPDALRPAWAERLADVGFDRAAIDRCYGRQRGPAVVTDAQREQLFNLMASAEGITEHASTFDRRDVLQFVADRSGDRLSATAVADLADAWLLVPEVVPLDPSARDARRGDVIRRHDGRRVNAVGTEALYTTRQMLSIEGAIDAAYLRGREAHVPNATPATVDAVLGTRGHLGDDQVEMVRTLTGSSARIQTVLGPAGAGKTTALEAAARIWELDGFNVIGGAVQGTAAEVVGDTAKVAHATVASVLWRAAVNDPAINERTKILIDECSALGNRDLSALMRVAEKTDASLVLIGDPAQHTAVAAGGAWRRLLSAYPDDVARLREVRRQRGHEMADVRQALSLWRDGEVDAAVKLLNAHGRVVTASDRDELMMRVVDDWYSDRLRREANDDLAPSSMMTDRHRERRELNALARERLVADGTLVGPVLRAGELAFQVGDEVMALEQDRKLRPKGAHKRGDFVHTAERGRVVGVHLPRGRHEGSLGVDFERRGLVEVPMEYLTRPLERGITGALAHSYALTTHAAQGDTYDAARPIATDASSAKSIYVGVTRGTHDVRLYVAFQDELSPSPSAHPEMPRLAPETSALAAVVNQIKDDRDELLATEIDPLATQVAAMAKTHNLARLDELATSSSLAAPIAAKARDQAQDAIARRAILRPDPDLLPRIGVRPAAPVDRRLWDDAVGQVALYRARYCPTPVPGGASATWALGPIPDDP
ncbi:MAG: relaxase domain-containing protein, partial [Actinomycetota bacterium]|nr:relaxase domain-containing protein [Actinomycetota bacterium]